MSDFQQQLLSHFEAHDPVLLPHLVALNGRSLSPTVLPENYFSRLVQDIISQQLSIKVAEVIIGRFEALLPVKGITPENVLMVDDEKMRAAGMSWAKIKYVKDLATKVVKREITLDNLGNSTDAEVIAELIKVKGIGQWTAEMFLIFTLGREDVFSVGDLGLKNAITKLYGLETADKKTFATQALRLSQKWQPYRSYASLALWKSLEK